MSQLFNPVTSRKPVGSAVTLLQRVSEGLIDAPRPDPVDLGSPGERPEPLPFISVTGRESVVSLAGRQQSIAGSIGENLIFGEALGASRSFDPEFNPYDLLTPEFLEANPHMVAAFESGDVLNIPNEEAFYASVERERARFDDAERLAQVGGFTATAGSIVGQVPDIALTVYGAKGVGLGAAGGVAYGERVRNTVAFLRSGSLSARGARVAGAAGGNVFQELGLQWADPTRKVELDQSIAVAGLMGAAFGGTLEASFHASRHVGAGRQVRGFRRTIRELRESFEPYEGLNTIDDVAAHDEAVLTALLDKPVDGPRQINPIATDTTRPLIRALERKYAEAGEDLHVNTHAGQEFLEAKRQLDELEQGLEQDANGLRDILAGKGNTASEAQVRLLNTLRTFTPGAKLAFSPSRAVRVAHRAFFDEATPTTRQVSDPLTEEGFVSAEALRQGVRTRMYEARMGVASALQTHAKSGGGKVNYTTASGETIRIGPRSVENLGRAAIDYRRRRAAVNRGKLPPESLSDVPRVVKDAEASVGRYFGTMLDRLEQVDLLQGRRALAEAEAEVDALRAQLRESIGDEAAFARTSRSLMEASERADDLRRFQQVADTYIPRRWLRREVSRRRPELQRKLVEQWQKNRRVDFHTGAEIPIELRTIDRGVVRRLDAEDQVAIGRLASRGDDPVAAIEGFSEGRLRDADAGLYQRYDAAYAKHLDEQAEKTTDRMLGLSKEEGVRSAHGFDSALIGGRSLIPRRLLELDEDDFADFLDDNLDQTLIAYDHTVGGEIAARRGVQENAGKLAPLVRENLDQDLDGSPDQVLLAVQAEFQRWIEVAKAAGDMKRVRQMEAARDQAVNILDRKMKELRGQPAIPDSPAVQVGFRHVIARHALQLPGLAYLGKVTISSIPDVANLMLYSRMEPAHFEAIASGIGQLANILERIPRDGVEGLAVAIDDDGIARTMQLLELNHLPISPQFPDTVGGRAAATLDRSLEGLNSAFFRINGMNRWNTTWKRVGARLILWEMHDGAQKMAKAADLVRGGMDQDAAFRQVGLSKKDATRLNRLGVNGARARGIVEQFERHGTDKDGNAFRPGSKGIVHPNFENWTDPSLVDRVSAAVDSEIDNIIVTPKLLSRPLINTDPRFGFIGKAFNLFQSFAFAYGNQLAPTVAQRPGGQVVAWMLSSVFLGAMSDAIHNHLSGRRSLADSASKWGENPQGMAYMAMGRAGMFGWLSKPLGIADAAGFGPGPMLGNDVSSMGAARALTVHGNISPFVDWAENLNQGLLFPALTDEKYDFGTLHALRKSLPFQNWWVSDLLYQATKDAQIDNPLGPGVGIDPFLTRPVQERRFGG